MGRQQRPDLPTPGRVPTASLVDKRLTLAIVFHIEGDRNDLSIGPGGVDVTVHEWFSVDTGRPRDCPKITRTAFAAVGNYSPPPPSPRRPVGADGLHAVGLVVLASQLET